MIKAVIFDWMGTLYMRGTGLLPGVEDTLKQLKSRYRLGIVSIATEGIEERRKIIEESGVAGYFDAIVLDFEKTPKQYQECLQKLGVTPAECAVAEDGLHRGVKIANEIGCTTYWVDKNKETALFTEEKKAQIKQMTTIIESVNELVQLLQ